MIRLFDVCCNKLKHSPLNSFTHKKFVQVVANNGNANYKHFFAQATMCCWDLKVKQMFEYDVR
jgi:hypothetical protein